MAVCQTIKASDVAKSHQEETRRKIKENAIRPKLVAFLANDDPAAENYAQWTEKSCNASGILFELRKIARTDLEEAIIAANNDNLVHGIMVYYPVFGASQDQYIQNCINVSKDAEGLCHTYRFNLYHNIRYLDQAQTKKCILPCTPLALVKALEYVGAYNKILPYGDRLYGKVVTIINRSEIVGRPLAALLANDGAKVYSLDVNGILEFHRGKSLTMKRHDVEESKKSTVDALSESDIVISGVPAANFKVDTNQLKDGVIAINFSSSQNFSDDIATKAAVFVPSIGKVTVSMLGTYWIVMIVSLSVERNLLRLFEYQ